MMELIVDSFAGGGGASTGIEMALARSPDIAINHDAVALAMHEVNHPKTLHLPADIWSVDPLTATGGRPVGLLWASPDCKHFSKAKGGKPVEKKIRGLAWVVVHWANTVRPRVIILENVEEFQTWGPCLTASDFGSPCVGSGHAAVPLDFRHLRRDHGEVRPPRRPPAAAGHHGTDRQGREALRARRGKAVHRQPDTSWWGADGLSPRRSFWRLRNE